MRIGGVTKRKSLLDLNLYFACRNNVEELTCDLFELGACRRVIVHCRSSYEERAFARQQDQREGVYRPGSVAEAYHHPARCQAVQRLHEGVASHAVVDDRYF